MIKPNTLGAAGRSLRRPCLLLAAALGILGCGRPSLPGTTDPAGVPSEQTGAIRLALAGGKPPEVRAVRFVVRGEGRPPARREVPLEDHPFPGAGGDPGGASFADALFVLEPGRYEVGAELVGSKGAAVPGCALEKTGRVTVEAGTTIEIVLRIQCRSASGGLDAVVVVNSLPTFEGVIIEGGKYLCRGQAATVTPVYKDLDGHRVAVTFQVAPPAEAPDAAACLVANEERAVFSTTVAGRYAMTVSLNDGHGALQSLTFPLIVSDCAQPPAPACAARVFRAQYGAPKTEVGDCSCLTAARRRNPRSSDQGPVPPYLYNYGTVLVETDQPCPPRGRWSGSLIHGRCAAGEAPPCRPRVFDCRYTWTDPNLAPLFSELGSGATEGDSGLACDQPLVALQGEGVSYPALPTGAYAAIDHNFRTRVRTVEPADFALLEDGRSPVEIAVVDSAVHAYGSGERDYYGHGRAIGRVIADLACPGARKDKCRVDNYLALDRPSIDAPPDRRDGGIYGDLSTLALSIHQALDAWIARTPPGTRANPLVINLSLGWDPRHLLTLPAFNRERAGEGLGDGVDTCAVTAGTAARQYQLLEGVVKRALERASCLGALVVAAAGNGDVPRFADAADPDGGALLPAAWETVEAPGSCAAQGLRPPGWLRPEGGGAYRPLLYAATGLGKEGRFVLGNARSNAVSRLGGMGMEVVRAETRPPRPAPGFAHHTQLLAGSSLAAATISGVAGVAWSLRPAASGHEIMALLHGTGDVVFAVNAGADSSDDFKEAEPTLRLASACAAGTADCARTKRVLHCQAVTAAAGTTPPSGRTSFCPERLMTVAPHPMNVEAPAEVTTPLPEAPGAFPASLRTSLSDGYVPWSGPQPPPGSCPSCEVGPGSGGGGGRVVGRFAGAGSVFGFGTGAAAAPSIRKAYLTLFGHSQRERRTYLLFDQQECLASGRGCSALRGEPFAVDLGLPWQELIDLHVDAALLTTVIDPGDGSSVAHSQPVVHTDGP